MKNYELTLLISPDLSEEELKLLKEKIISLIQKEGGILNQESPLTKKSLAFPIKKRQSAYFVTLDFQILPEKIEDLEKKLKGEGKILRYLISVKTPIKEVFPKIKKLAKIEKPKAKVELKEIEKKLEEILGE